MTRQTIKDASYRILGYIDTRSLDLVARTAGSGYARTRDTFDLVRPTWSDWQKRQSPTESVKQGDRP